MEECGEHTPQGLIFIESKCAVDMWWRPLWTGGKTKLCFCIWNLMRSHFKAQNADKSRAQDAFSERKKVRKKIMLIIENVKDAHFFFFFISKLNIMSFFF